MVKSNLKSLHCGAFRADTATILEKLLPKCPALENLTIDTRATGEDDYSFKIFALGLRTLILQNYYDKNNYSFFINAPKLENLVVSGKLGFSDYYFSDNAKSLVKEEIFSVEEDNLRAYSRFYGPIPAPSLVGGVSGVTCLSLSTPVFLSSSLPSFDGLKQLKVALLYCHYWEYVMELLEKSPNLEDLVLDIKPSTWRVYSPPWNPPESVPACVSSKLKTISIDNFMGYRDEFAVVKYMLKYGEILKQKIAISTDDSLIAIGTRMTREELYKKILKLQQRSKSCEIKCSYCRLLCSYYLFTLVLPIIALSNNCFLCSDLLSHEDLYRYIFVQHIFEFCFAHFKA